MKLLILSLFILSGCSVQTLLVDVEPERGVVKVTKPPVEIYYSGDISKESKKFVDNIVSNVHMIEYKEYKFNESSTLKIDTTNTKNTKVPKVGGK